MPEVLLGDVSRERKETCKGSKSGYPIVGLEHMVPEELTLHSWSDDSENTFSKVFRKGDVLFGRRRAYLKKAAVAPFDGICSGDITVIEANAERIVPELLPFIIQNDALFDYAVGKSAGSLSPRVKWEHLKNYKFELPEMAKQRELAELLWAMDEAKKSYQELISATDALVKSQFIEMFGDKDFPVCKLLEQCEVITKGTTPTTIGFNFTDSGVNFVKIENITPESTFIPDGMMYISDECNSSMKRSQLKQGDILFSIAGAIGRCTIVTDDILPANINQALAIVRLRNDTVLDKKFLLAALKSKYVEDQYLALKRGAAQLNLSLKDVGNFTIPVPSSAMQEQFVTLYEQSDKSKFELEQALSELKATYKRIIAENLG